MKSNNRYFHKKIIEVIYQIELKINFTILITNWTQKSASLPVVGKLARQLDSWCGQTDKQTFVLL